MSIHPMGRRIRLMSVAALALTAAVLAACGGGDSGDATTSAAPARAVTVPKTGIVAFHQPEAGSGSGLKLGFIALGDQIPFSKIVTDSMRRNAQLAGAQLVVCDSQTDSAKALTCARNFKTQGVQAYLNYQIDQKAAPAVCAAGPDVPVIAVSIEQRPCQIARMGAADSYAGFIAGQALGRYAKDNWDCDYDAYVSLESTAAGETSRKRMDGYRAGFQSVCAGGLKNERTLDADNADKARTQFADTLTALPGQHRIVVASISDDPIRGALAAAKTAGREDDVYVSGQGADESSWCEIKTNDHWIADSGYFPERYGEIGIPYLIKAARGERIPPLLLVDHQLVTRENVDELYHPSGC
ncbi:MAG TPA: sugar ABC transporter substrate-binding protein [Conexibacter sp.]|nr:sugar ABC transporter substrate-binding protein [Conexibacter sp.]